MLFERENPESRGLKRGFSTRAMFAAAALATRTRPGAAGGTTTTGGGGGTSTAPASSSTASRRSRSRGRRAAAGGSNAGADGSEEEKEQKAEAQTEAEEKAKVALQDPSSDLTLADQIEFLETKKREWDEYVAQVNQNSAWGALGRMASSALSLVMNDGATSVKRKIEAKLQRRKEQQEKEMMLMPYYQHVEERIDELGELLNTYEEVKVTIPLSSIGRGLAEEQWRDAGFTDEQIERFVTYLHEYLMIVRHSYPQQVQLGRVEYAGADPTNLNVWGVTAENWDIGDNITLIGEAGSMFSKRKKLGVFGIVTTPVGGIPGKRVQQPSAVEAYKSWKDQQAVEAAQDADRQTQSATTPRPPTALGGGGAAGGGGEAAAAAGGGGAAPVFTRPPTAAAAAAGGGGAALDFDRPPAGGGEAALGFARPPPSRAAAAAGGGGAVGVDLEVIKQQLNKLEAEARRPPNLDQNWKNGDFTTNYDGDIASDVRYDRYSEGKSDEWHPRPSIIFFRKDGLLEKVVVFCDSHTEENKMTWWLHNGNDRQEKIDCQHYPRSVGNTFPYGRFQAKVLPSTKSVFKAIKMHVLRIMTPRTEDPKYGGQSVPFSSETERLYRTLGLDERIARIAGKYTGEKATAADLDDPKPLVMSPSEMEEL